MVLKFSYGPQCVANKGVNCWTRHRLLHCEENGCGEGSQTFPGYEHPGNMSDIYLRSNDRRLHRPCGHLLR